MAQLRRLPFLLTLIVLVLALQKCQSSPLTVKPDQALIISTTLSSSTSNESTEVEDDIDSAAKPSPAVASTENSSQEFGSLPSSKDPNVKPMQLELPLAGKTEKNVMKKSSLKPEIYSFKIHSDVKYRYARTYVTSRVVNANPTEAQEVTFRVVLPETAFISKFIMEIDGTPYEAYVKEKEEAKKVYNQAQSQGQSAGLVELNTRNANVFDVNVNIKSQSKVNFNLTYEELLSRRLGRYEQSISITSDQITNVKDFQISVSIEESQNITLLRVPNLRNDVDAPADSEGNNQDAVIERPAGNKANITWKPSEKDQNQLAKQGVTGKFIVQYDIKRELDAGEVLVMNGYFVHFFAPENLPALRKHVVFVLDTSGSMWGRRMEQLKEAMNQILADLSSEDFFNILTFSSDVVLWSPEDKISASSWSPPPFHGERVVTTVEDPRRRQPYPATKENIEKAQKFIQSLVASGGTNIHDSIVQALNLTAAIKKNRDQDLAPSVPNVTENGDGTTTAQPGTTTVATSSSPSSSLNVLPANVESLLMFLTDGESTVGITTPATIVTLVQEANKNISTPIFGLGFGTGADFPLIRKISLQNYGFARKIYEAADAALQLKGFYKEIASPLLSNVKFNYTTPESAYTVENVTITRFPTVFRGTEIAVAGRLVPKPVPQLTDPQLVDPQLVDPQLVDPQTDPQLVDPQTDPQSIAPQLTEETTTESASNSEENAANINEDATILIPTTQHYFDVEIGGSGRDGEVLFLKPEIFSCIIPWEGTIVRPFPPRPTPAPTQEDVFLERLWAYLTIQQLIEKDLAQNPKENELEQDDQDDGTVGQNIPAPVFVTPGGGAVGTPGGVQPALGLVPHENSPTTPPSTNESTTVPPGVLRNSSTVPETPKQKALRLALKYGFVTSLTSLVVVKPNSSDVTNAVAADANPDSPDSLAAPQSINMNSLASHKVAFISGGGYANRIVAGGNSNYAAAGIVPFSHSRPSFAAYGPPSPMLHAAFQQRPVLALATQVPSLVPISVEEDQDYVAEVQSTSASTPRPPSTTFPPWVSSTPPLPSVMTVVTSDESTTQSVEDNLTLKDLTWFNGSTIKVNKDGNEAEYNIIVDDNVKVDAPANCTVSGSAEVGQCVHLKDCVQTVFLDDFDLYAASYFCQIKSNVPVAAGVCCVTTEKSV